MKVLIAPDKFKGSLTASEVCVAIEKGIHNHDPNIECISIPLADGGEGSLDLVESVQEVDRQTVSVRDPLMRNTQSYYLKDSKTAYIEMAKASGLGLLDTSERNPLYTTTIGTGELIYDALHSSYQQLIVFVGGSATNDGGLGVGQALGYRFVDKDGLDILPIGANLSQIHKIVRPKSFIKKNIVVATDVENLFTGPYGATLTYGQQKGASKDELVILEKGMCHLEYMLKEELGVDISKIKGAGAAGGIAGGLVAFMRAEIKSGANILLEASQFDARVKEVDLVITGEGKIDRQTLQGKLVKRIIDITALHKKPTVVLCGLNELIEEEVDSLALNSILSISDRAKSLPDAMNNAAQYLEQMAYAMIQEM